MICLFAKWANHCDEVKPKSQLFTIRMIFQENDVNADDDDDIDDEEEDINQSVFVANFFLLENFGCFYYSDSEVIRTSCKVLRSFRKAFKWMYPQTGGNEHVEMAALGVLILWFAW